MIGSVVVGSGDVWDSGLVLMGCLGVDAAMFVQCCNAPMPFAAPMHFAAPMPFAAPMHFVAPYFATAPLAQHDPTQVEALQTAVGSQGGQLSSVLPALARDVHDMQRKLAEGLQGDRAPGPSVKDVEEAVAGVLQPYSDLVRILCISGDRWLGDCIAY